MVDVDISYEDDVDHAMIVLRNLIADLQDDPNIGGVIIAPPEITGIEALGPHQVTIRVLVKTLPAEQWRVQRELRLRIKHAFERQGLTIPYPHSVSVVRESGGTQTPEADTTSQEPAN
jgi:small conductance mechanosensitive channel